MNQPWKIVYYQSPQQTTSPIYDFINGLDSISQAKISNTLNLLETFGVKLGPPHSKKLTGIEIWELRVLGKANIRIFYLAIVNQSFLLLHAFSKKKQQTDKKEVKIAAARLAEYRSRVKK